MWWVGNLLDLSTLRLKLQSWWPFWWKLGHCQVFQSSVFQSFGRWHLWQCIRAPPRRGRYWEIHPRRPRDFLRPERFPEGEARGKSRGSREISRAEGMDFPIPPESWWSTDILSSSNFLQGVDQQILPCGQGRIDSVKINPSLLMMRECDIYHSAGIY